MGQRSRGVWLERAIWGLVIAAIGLWLWPLWRAGEIWLSVLTAWQSAQVAFMPSSIDWPILLLPTLGWVIGLLLLRELFPQPNAWVRGVASLSLIGLGIRYEIWRCVSTLNLEDPLNGSLSLLLFVMELLTFVNTAAFLCQTIPSVNRTPEADYLSQAVLNATYRPTVDVLIPTYNEPPAVLRRTVIGCQAMTYEPKRVYLLDDLQRPAIQSLAAELGCQYITRGDNRHAKAGNLNHAIAQTQGELIAIFDADFVPTTNFLTRTVGFFQAPQVALVQTPQNFYNQDPVSVNLGLQSVLTNEQTLFFRYIQPSRDATDSVICCGSSFVIRRTALTVIGGIPTESITEDFFLSLKLQSQGYRIKYLNECLSAGLSPETIGDYIDQRLRWGQGTLQTLFSQTNLFCLPGLTRLQRFSHGMGLLYWFLSVPRLIFLLMPLAYLLFELAPLRATVDGLLTFYIPYYLGNLMVFAWLTGGRRSAFWSDVYETLLCVPMTLTLIRTLHQPFARGFQVTPKGETTQSIQAHWRLAVPLVVVMGLSIFGLVMRLTGAHWSTVNPDSLIVNVIWSIYNLGLLQICLLVAIDVPRRSHSRFTQRYPCQLRSPQGIWSGHTLDVSEGGAALRLSPSNHEVPLPPQADLWLAPIPQTLPSQLRWQEWDAPATRLVTGVQFLPLPLATQRALITFLYCQPGQWPDHSIPEHVTAWAWLRSLLRLYALADTR